MSANRLNGFHLRRVIRYVRVLAVFVCVLLMGPGLARRAAAQEPPGLGTVLSKIELHYNSLATLRIDFEQAISYAGRPPRRESGTLSLLRPSKMRWDYSEPPGKLLVGDGEVLHMYNPRSNQVRQIRVNETADLRAPLSFLLGRLRFRRQFENLRLEEIGGRTVLVGEGRPGKDPYSRVEFTYHPEDYRLEHLRVVGHDETITTFRFENETVNPRLDPSRFEFQAPPGVEVVEDYPREEIR